MVFVWLILFPLILLSAVELWLVLTLGPLLGTGWTIAWMVGSFFLGMLLLRIEGVIKLVHIHRMLLAEEIPTRDLMDLFLILVGAVMLILPGFLTDAVGLLLLIPPVRWGLRESVMAGLRRMVANGRMAGSVRQGGDVIEIFPEKDEP